MTVKHGTKWHLILENQGKFGVNMLLEIVNAVWVSIALGVVAVLLWIGFCIFLEVASRSKSERVALAQFKVDYPTIRPGFTSRQRREELEVVTIFYGSTKPPSRKYYLIEPNQAAREVDISSKHP